MNSRQQAKQVVNKAYMIDEEDPLRFSVSGPLFPMNPTRTSFAVCVVWREQPLRGRELPTERFEVNNQDEKYGFDELKLSKKGEPATPLPDSFP